MSRVRVIAVALGVLLIAPLVEAESAIETPTIAGPWRELFLPKKSGNYINDHTVYRDPKGDWHLVGITSKGNRFGLGEEYFAHGVSSSLDVPMTELAPLFKGYPDHSLKWAPHAIWDGDTLHLFCGPGEIKHYTSKDGYNFKYEGVVIKGWKFLRDTMVLKIGDEWIMYATDTIDGGHNVSAWKSKDLFTWTKIGAVFTAIRPANLGPRWWPGSICESPFVIKRGDGFYLSITFTVYPLIPHKSNYLNTLVFYSVDPLNFGVYAAGGKGETARLVTRLETHAPEYIQDDAGKWWITESGWKGFPRPKGCPGGMACIAPLEWK